MIYFIIATMGSGKTLCSTLFAIDYRNINPNNQIYANYNILNLSNFTYTKFGFLPFNKINNCLIILDDISAIKNQIQGLLQIIANASRKASIDIVITCQYYTMIPKSIRELGNQLLVSYVEPIDTLYVAKENKNSQGTSSFDYYFISNAVKIAKKHYDTNEIVSFSTEKDLILEVINVSSNWNDITQNIEYLTQSEKKRNYFKKMAKEFIIKRKLINKFPDDSNPSVLV